MDRKRAYATLGLQETASPDELRRAYRAQLQRHHPDTGAGDVRALALVTAAYHELAPRLTPSREAPARPRLHVDVYA